MLNDAQSVLLERDAAHLIHPLHLPAGHTSGKVWAGGEGEFLIDANGKVRWQEISYEPFMAPKFLLDEAKRLLAQPAKN